VQLRQPRAIWRKGANRGDRARPFCSPPQIWRGLAATLESSFSGELRRQALPLYLFLVIHLGVYLVSWVMIRYRIPADTVLLLFAGLAIARLGQVVKLRQQER